MSKIKSKSKKVNKKNRFKIIRNGAIITILGVSLAFGGLFFKNKKEKDTTTIANDENSSDIELEPLFDEYSIITTLHKNDLIEQGYIVSDTIFDYDIKCNLLELSSLMGNESITWDSLKEIVKNRDISDKYKNMLYECINNWKNSNLNIDLTAIKYNLSNLKIKSMPKEKGITGEFKVNECILYMCDDYDEEVIKKTFIHEISHGFTQAYVEINGKKVYCSNNENIVEKDNKSIYNIGHAYDEALADYLTALGLNEKIDCKDLKWAYGLNLYELLIVTNIAKIDIYAYANNGLMYLFNELDKQGMSEVKQYTFGFDTFSYDAMGANEAALKSYNGEILNYVTDIFSIYYSTGKSYDEIIELFNCYKGYIIPFEVSDGTTTLNVIKNTTSLGFALENLKGRIDSMKTYYEGKTY